MNWQTITTESEADTERLGRTMAVLLAPSHWGQSLYQHLSRR